MLQSRFVVRFPYMKGRSGVLVQTHLCNNKHHKNTILEYPCTSGWREIKLQLPVMLKEEVPFLVAWLVKHMYIFLHMSLISTGLIPVHHMGFPFLESQV